MTYKRNYRKRRSANNLGSAVGDMGAIANKFGAKGALITGVIGFVVLYFLIPAALEAWLEYNKAKMTGPTASVMGQVLDKIFNTRFIRVSEWAGIAALLLCTAIAAWKAVTQESVSYQGQRDASFLAKLFARFLD